MTNRFYYKVLLVGTSGRGKTYSFRDMDKDKTLFINVENKPFPFKGGFKHHIVPKTPQEVLNAIQEGHKNPEVTAVVVDSFSAYTDMLINEARATKKGFDVFNHYNAGIASFNTYVKNTAKEVFVTAHYEIIQDEVSGTRERRVKVKAKEFEGMVEKDYTICLFAEVKPKAGGMPDYYLTTVNDGTNSAKCPPDLFGTNIMQIPNDAKFIFEKIQEYVK